MGWLIYGSVAIRTGSSGTTLQTVSDGLIVYRYGTRSSHFVIDKSEDGGSTWELNLLVLESDEDLATLIMGTDATYRNQVRDGAFMLDHALDATGFDGDENVNWENIYSLNNA